MPAGAAKASAVVGSPTRGRRHNRQPKARPGTRPTWADPFLATLRKCAVITYAARAAGIDRQTAYNLRDKSPEFAAEMVEALEEGNEVLIREAWRRAVDGTEEPIVSGGEIITTVPRYSDQLMGLLLKGFHPNQFKDRHEVSSSLAMSAVQGKLDRAAAAVLKHVRDPEVLDKIQAEWDQIDKA